MQTKKAYLISALTVTAIILTLSCTVSYNTARVSLTNNTTFPLIYKGQWYDKINGDASDEIQTKILYAPVVPLATGDTQAFDITWLPYDQTIDVTFSWGRWYPEGEGTNDVYSYQIDPFFKIKTGQHMLLSVDGTTDYDLTLDT
jgi:hypothetical protein